jgi:hypothetical protein
MISGEIILANSSGFSRGMFVGFTRTDGRSLMAPVKILMIRPRLLSS